MVSRISSAASRRFILCMIITLVSALIAHKFPAVCAAIQRHARPTATAQLSHVRVYFSPDDDLRTMLIALIRAETDHIALASYLISDPAIIDELIAAHERNVSVEVVSCRSGAADSWSKIDRLIDAGLPVYIYPAPYIRSLMHHKFALFSASNLVATGSANWTKSGFDANREHILVHESAPLVSRFSDEFERLKRLSIRVATLVSYKALTRALKRRVATQRLKRAHTIPEKTLPA